jgi:hypothetical protein
VERRPFSTATLAWLGIIAMVLNVAVNGVWTALLIANVRTTPAIPWAVLAMAIILSLLWQYLNGRWAPAKTSEFFIAAVAASIKLKEISYSYTQEFRGSLCRNRNSLLTLSLFRAFGKSHDLLTGSANPRPIYTEGAT